MDRTQLCGSCDVGSIPTGGTKMTDDKWLQYYKTTRGRAPRPLLVKALEYVSNKDMAIDIGAGALSDTVYLLDNGFDVTAIDKSPFMEEEDKNIPSDKLHPFIIGFEDFDFGKDRYDIANAINALPFTNPGNFDSVFKNIKNSLKNGGIFCGQFFGVNDEWSSDPLMTFHTKEQVESLLSDMNIISLIEQEKDTETAKGDMKHWHLFHVIARKK